MKTNDKNSKMNFLRRNFITSVALALLTGVACAQEFDSTRTLLGPDVKISNMWVPEIKVNSIQGEVGTLIGGYGGILINRSYLIGIAGGVNLGHPTVNYGYFGGIAQVIVSPARMFHFSSQVILAWGTTKDYQSTKKGLLDNFWNISGEDFYLTEPGINIEVNLKENVTLVAGVSYRFVFRLDPNNENVRFTHVTNDDMTGLNFNIGIKFGGKIRQKDK